MVVLGRESRGLTQSGLARLLGTSQSHLSKIEAGLLPVPDELLGRISLVLNYPPEFFRMSEPIFGPGASEFFHRKRQALPARLLAQLHAQVNIRRIHVARLLRSVELDDDRIPELDPDAFPGSVEDIAHAVRAAWSLPRGRVENVTRAIEDAGGVVVQCDFGTNLLDAVSRWVPGLPPLFFVNQDTPADRARLTLAHELGHMVMHRIPGADMETEAYRFAQEFLMPERDIRGQLDNLTLDRLISLKLHWRVSMQAILKRAESLGRITPRKARYLWMQISKAGYRTREPVEADVPREEPQLLMEIIDLHSRRLGFSPEHLAYLLALEEDEMVRIYPMTIADREPRLRLIPQPN